MTVTWFVTEEEPRNKSTCDSRFQGWRCSGNPGICFGIKNQEKETENWFTTMTPPLTCCVTLSKLLTFSGLQFSLS